jgi:hypothetical protein
MKFDDWFAEQTRQAFDKYNETPSDTDWQQFQQKLPPITNGHFSYKIWASAAAIILALISGYYIVIQPFDNQRTVLENELNTPKETPFLTSDSVTVNNPTPTQQLENNELAIVHSEKKVYTKENLPKSKTIKTNKEPNSESIGKSEAVSSNGNKPPTTISETQSEMKPDSNLSKQWITTIQPNEKKTEDSKTVSDSDLIRKKTNSNRYAEIHLGTSVTSVNSIGNDGLGVLFGMIHFWKFSEKLHFGTGGLIAQTSTNLISLPRLQAEDVASVLQSSNASPVSVSSTRELQTTALEIPVYVKWNVGSFVKTPISLTAGIASLLYINQTFSETGMVYSGISVQDENGAMTFAVQSSEYSNDEETPAFAQNDWAGLVHISSSIQLSPKWETEVFVKLPISKLTQQQVNLNFVGFSLRYKWFEK